MNTHTAGTITDPQANAHRTLIRILAWLRLCAIGGQLAAISFVASVLQIHLPFKPLLGGVCVLIAFAVIAAVRLHWERDIHEGEIILHVAVDTCVLGYLLYLTGGASNPFISLLLVPIALAAAAASLRIIVSVAILAVIAYVCLLLVYVPLPELQHVLLFNMPLHTIGNATNFVIMGLLLGIFIHRLAATLRTKHGEVQHIRERALRDEGILAIATQAAGVAHEMNTPLSTMRTLLPELRHEHADDPVLTADLSLLEDQVERCRTSLREMVALGKQRLAQRPEAATLQQFIDSCLHQFRLLRPDAQLVYTPPSESSTILAIEPGLRHAVINLLNNALEASMQRGSQHVGLHITTTATWVEFTIADEGEGFIGNKQQFVALGHTEKRAGLGLGLALAQATAERLKGRLSVRNHAHGGEIRLRLPLATIHITE